MPTAYILYESAYGSSQTYAEALAARVGGIAQSFADPLPDDGTPVVVMSYIHGPFVPAVNWYREHQHSFTQPRNIALAIVGMTPLQTARDQDIIGKSVDVAHFYLPGALQYSKLRTKHKAVLTSLVAALKMKPRRNIAEENIVRSYGQDINGVDFAELDSIVTWIEQH